MEAVDLKTLVSEVMTKKVYSLAPNDLMGKVKTLFDQHRIHHIPIVDEEQRVVGMVSTQDYHKILHAFTVFSTQASQAFNRSIQGALLVKDIMVKNVVTIREDEPIQVAAKCFLENKFHALPVVDAAGKLCGILTSHDLLALAFS